MGRGQLKHRKRGGRGGGPASGGRGPADRDTSTGATQSHPQRGKAGRRGGEQHHNASHLPSNTERWGLSVGEGQQGGRAGPASTSAVGFQETERLLGESDWAAGASSWRLGAPRTEDPGDWAADAAGAGELLSLNVDVLGKCLQRIPAHERLNLPVAYTAELEAQAQQEYAAEPATATAAVVLLPPPPTPTTNRTAAAPGRAEAAATAAVVETDEDGVLDALLVLPAAGAVAVAVAGTGGSPRGVESKADATSASGEGKRVVVVAGDDGEGKGASLIGADEGVGVDVGEFGSDAQTGRAGVDVGGGNGGGGGGGGADELEDWLDGMLADS